MLNCRGRAQPGEAGGPAVHELAGMRRARQRWRAVALQPLPGQELATLKELGAEQTHLVQRREGSVAGRSGRLVVRVGARFPVVYFFVFGDRGERLSERLREIAENVCRVV